MANEAMRAAWAGDEGEHWAAHADFYDGASTAIMREYVATTNVRPSDHVLDVGCGSGGLALDLAPSCQQVHGIDLSPQMIEVADKRAAEREIANATFEVADAQTDDLGLGYDLVVSSFGVMFFDDPVAAFANIATALQSGGRVSLAVWRDLRENEWLMRFREALAMGRDLPFPPVEAPTPFSLSNVERTTTILTDAGLADVVLTPVDKPMNLGTDADSAFESVRHMGIVRGLSHDLDDAQTVEALANLRSVLAAHQTSDGILIGTAAWTISARKP